MQRLTVAPGPGWRKIDPSKRIKTSGCAYPEERDKSTVTFDHHQAETWSASMKSELRVGSVTVLRVRNQLLQEATGLARSLKCVIREMRCHRVDSCYSFGPIHRPLKINVVSVHA